jgi:hypothetical protein
MSALPLPSPLGDYEAKDDQAGRLGLGGARPLVNENKLAIAAELWRTGHPMSSSEVREVLGEIMPLAAVEYHLSTLVMAGVAKPLFGPEIYFQSVPHGAMPSALTESKRTEP